MNVLPTLFVSHGAPLLALEDGPAHRFLKSLGHQYAQPRAILVASAHWESNGGPAVGTALQPRTIHDFGGFPRELYELQYPAAGAPGLAEEAAALLKKAGFVVRTSDSRGLDHGAWVPLMLMYPHADIPVFQVSLIHGAGPEEHFRLGRALHPLTRQDVLIIGSGSLTHNLYEYMGHRAGDAAPPWVQEFEDWVAEALRSGRVEELLDYRRLAPHAVRNHPTEEHLLPLYVALGAAGGNASAVRLHASHTYGVIAMDAYAFSSSAPNDPHQGEGLSLREA